MFSAQRKDSVCSHPYVLGVIDFEFRYNFFKVAVDPQTTLPISHDEIHCQ